MKQVQLERDMLAVKANTLEQCLRAQGPPQGAAAAALTPAADEGLGGGSTAAGGAPAEAQQVGIPCRRLSPLCPCCHWLPRMHAAHTGVFAKAVAWARRAYYDHLRLLGDARAAQ